MSPASESLVLIFSYIVQLPWTLLTNCQGSSASTDQHSLINGNLVDYGHPEWAMSNNVLRALALRHLATVVSFPKPVKLGTFLNSQLCEFSQLLSLLYWSHLSHYHHQRKREWWTEPRSEHPGQWKKDAGPPLISLPIGLTGFCTRSHWV